MEETVLSKSGIERRRAPRLEHPLLVAYRSAGAFCSDLGTNLSTGGMFVNTQNPLPEGTNVNLLVSLPDENAPCRVTGEVVRVQQGSERDPPGMAIKFIDTSRETQARIDELVAQLRRKLEQEHREP